MRILVVDDDAEILMVVGRWLHACGHRPVTTSDSRTVMRMIETQDFDLVCLDLMMPYINGLQLIPAIRERKPALPIVIISCIEDTRIAVQAARQGIEDYLPKPIEFNRLDAILQRLNPGS